MVAVVARKLMGRAVKVGEAEVPDASGAVPLRLGRTRWNTMDSAGRSGRPTGIGLPSGDRFPPDAASSNRLGTASATVWCDMRAHLMSDCKDRRTCPLRCRRAHSG